jgi:hypothetical protein
MTHILGEGGPTDKESLGLDTRQGNHIRNVRKLERHPDAMAAAVRIMEGAYVGAHCVSATAVYNCAGLVFGSRRTWVDPDVVDWVLREDGFDRLPDHAKWDVGDIVVYRKGTEVSHVGVIRSIQRRVADAETEVIVVSAWGNDGEYVHPWQVVSPLLGTPVEVWSQRKAVT